MTKPRLSLNSLLLLGALMAALGLAPAQAADSVYSLTFSPDGQRLAWVYRGAVYTADLDGGMGATRLDFRLDPPAPPHARWDRDGFRLLTAAPHGRSMNLWRINIATGGAERLTDALYRQQQPVPVPQRGGLVYTAFRDALPQLWYLDAESQAFQLTFGRSAKFDAMAGRRGQFVYYRDRLDGIDAVHRISLDDGVYETLHHGPEPVAGFALDAEGRRMAALLPGRVRLVELPPRRQGVTGWRDVPVSTSSAAFGPGGQALYVDGLRRVDLQGGGVDTLPGFGAGAVAYRQITASPGGERLAFAARMVAGPYARLALDVVGVVDLATGDTRWFWGTDAQFRQTLAVLEAEGRWNEAIDIVRLRLEQGRPALIDPEAMAPVDVRKLLTDFLVRAGQPQRAFELTRDSLDDIALAARIAFVHLRDFDTARRLYREAGDDAEPLLVMLNDLTPHALRNAATALAAREAGDAAKAAQHFRRARDTAAFGETAAWLAFELAETLVAPLRDGEGGTLRLPPPLRANAAQAREAASALREAIERFGEHPRAAEARHLLGRVLGESLNDAEAAYAAFDDEIAIRTDPCQRNRARLTALRVAFAAGGDVVRADAWLAGILNDRCDDPAFAVQTVREVVAQYDGAGHAGRLNAALPELLAFHNVEASHVPELLGVLAGVPLDDLLAAQIGAVPDALFARVLVMAGAAIVPGSPRESLAHELMRLLKTAPPEAIDAAGLALFDSGTMPPELRFAWRYVAGNLYQSAGRAAEAIARYEELTGLMGRGGAASFGVTLARLRPLLSRGEITPDDALALLNALRSERLGVWGEAAELLRLFGVPHAPDEGRPGEALWAFIRARPEHPLTADADFALAHTRPDTALWLVDHLERFPESPYRIAAFDRIVSDGLAQYHTQWVIDFARRHDRPWNDAAHRRHVNLALGRIFEDIPGRLDDAVNHYRQAARNGSQTGYWAAAQHRLAVLEPRRGFVHAGIEAAERLIGSHPNYPWVADGGALRHLAELYETLGRASRAHDLYLDYLTRHRRATDVRDHSLLRRLIPQLSDNTLARYYAALRGDIDSVYDTLGAWDRKRIDHLRQPLTD